MKSRVTAALVSSVILLASLAFAPVGAETGGAFEYEISGGEASVTRYIGSESEVSVPDALGGCPVTSIGASSFRYCQTLERVDLPASVREIGTEAFAFCTSLTGAAIPDGAETIGESAFWGCSSLTEVYIPGSVRSIGHTAFLWCSSLTDIVIRDGVETIGRDAFSGCSLLAEVTVPDSVKEIFPGAFADCPSLERIDVGEGSSEYRSVDGVVYTKDGKYLVACPGAKTEATVPNGVECIMNMAFYRSPALTYVTLPASVKRIGSMAFDICVSLTTVYYAGSQEDWSRIKVSDGNTFFNYAATVFDCDSRGIPEMSEIIGADSEDPSGRGESADSEVTADTAKSADSGVPAQTAKSADGAVPAENEAPVAAEDRGGDDRSGSDARGSRAEERGEQSDPGEDGVMTKIAIAIGGVLAFVLAAAAIAVVARRER